jgi:rSAM/selenodomain-associated transferase 1
LKQALIIFVRHPVLGKVKTRLAAALSAETALTIYKKLLKHTHEVSQEVKADKFIFYAEEVIEDDLWQHENYFKLQQENGDLGRRMKVAFEQVFAKGYDRVCIIGSDCYELSADIIKYAFRSLDEYDIAVGPAKDGGYYLLGMKQIYPEVFKNKNWSTNTVLKETIESIRNLNLRFIKLAMLTDVDEACDIPEAWWFLKD